MKVRDRRIIFVFVIKLICRKIKRSERTPGHILSLQVECFQVIGTGSVTSAIAASYSNHLL
jgi:hypothetical protein